MALPLYESLWLIFALALCLGLIAGLLSGMLGIGGGIVLVPGFYFGFQSLGFDNPDLMHVCVGTSLAVIVPTILRSASAHTKLQQVSRDNIRAMTPGVALGVLTGIMIADFMNGQSLRLLFAGTITFLAFAMLVNLRGISISNRLPRQIITMPFTVLSGGLSTLIGIGGTTLHVPFMTLTGTPLKTAIGTSAVLACILTLPAAIGFAVIGLDSKHAIPYSLGYINLPAALAVLPASLLAAPYGAKLISIIPLQIARRGFAAFMVLVALKLWSDML